MSSSNAVSFGCPNCGRFGAVLVQRSLRSLDTRCRVCSSLVHLSLRDGELTGVTLRKGPPRTR